MGTLADFEKNAPAFRKDTGIWPLGKDRAAAAGPIDEREVRSLAYIYWQKQQRLKGTLMDSNATIVDQIKKLIAETKTDDKMTELRKTSYVKGYMAALDGVQRLITLVESLVGGTDPE